MRKYHDEPSEAPEHDHDWRLDPHFASQGRVPLVCAVPGCTMIAVGVQANVFSTWPQWRGPVEDIADGLMPLPGETSNSK